MNRVALFLTGAFLYSPAGALADAAQDKATQNSLCNGAFGGSGGCSTDKNTNAVNTQQALIDKVATITNVLLYVTGAIAVIVIIIGGLRYVTSTGDATRIKQAKDTILYGVVGLIVAILAYAIVRFVEIQL